MACYHGPCEDTLETATGGNRLEKSSTKDSTPHYGLLLCVHTFTKRRNRVGCLCTGAISCPIPGGHVYRVGYINFASMCAHIEFSHTKFYLAKLTVLCHPPYSTPNTIGPRGTPWCIATSGVHTSSAFLERYSIHTETC